MSAIQKSGLETSPARLLWRALPAPSGCVVVLATELTPELVREGNARDLVRLIQDRRKELNLQFTDRIEVGIVTESAELRAAIEENLDYIKQETLAVTIVFEPLPGVDGVTHRIGDADLTIYVRVVRKPG